MKKTYKTPESFAVTLQHQDNVLVKTSFTYAGEGDDADVKAFEFVDNDNSGSTSGNVHSVWDSEW